MRFAIGETTLTSIRDVLERVRIAEECNYTSAWIGEELMGLREIFTYLSELAIKTKRIRLGLGITTPWIRNISLIASGTTALQELSNNRFVLGLGVGGLPEVKRITGKEPRNVVSAMRETVELLTQLFKGKKLSHKGILSNLTNYGLSFLLKVPPKIYFGVRGPKLLRLAGEIADGVIFSGPRDYLFDAIKIVDKSAMEHARSPKEIDHVLWTGFVLVEDEKDLDLGKKVAAIVSAALPDFVMRYVKVKDPKQFAKVVNLSRSGNYLEAAKLMPLEVVDEVCTAGNFDEIVKRFEEYEKHGFDEFIVGPPFGKDPLKVIRLFKNCTEV